MYTMNNLVKFPYSVSRRVHSRKPRRSKNGTPEERTSLEGRSAMSGQREERLTATCQKRLRDERRESAGNAAREYWKARLGMETSIALAQSNDLSERNDHPPHDPAE